MTVEPIIIDTDPGVDDVLAILFLLLSKEVHIKAITLTHGNTELHHIKRNAVTLLHVMQKHRAFVNSPLPFQELPVLAVGSELPLKSKNIYATYFHGKDGLGDVYHQGKYTAPPDWESQIIHQSSHDQEVAFPTTTTTTTIGDEEDENSKNDRPSNQTTRAFQTTERDGADEILYQLKQAPPLTISILAVGPLTNIALAYQRDPITLSRAKRILIMGGAVDAPGNVTPLAEFNFRADPDAANIVLSASKGFQPTPEGYRDRVDLITNGKQTPIHIVLLPLKAADNGGIDLHDYENHIKPLDTPLGVFCNAFLEHTFDVICNLYGFETLSIYDAYTGLLLLDMIPDQGDGVTTEAFDSFWKYKYIDLHVETSGHNTLGMTYYDKRPWAKNLTSCWHGDAPNHVQVMIRGNGERFRRIFMKRVFDVDIQ